MLSKTLAILSRLFIVLFRHQYRYNSCLFHPQDPAKEIDQNFYKMARRNFHCEALKQQPIKLTGQCSIFLTPSQANSPSHLLGSQRSMPILIQIIFFAYPIGI